MKKFILIICILKGIMFADIITYKNIYVGLDTSLNANSKNNIYPFFC